jgi:hypothetical protein
MEWTCSSHEMQEIIMECVRGNGKDREGGNLKIDHKLNGLQGCEVNCTSSVL